MHWLRSAIPLPLVEFSHLTGSLVGVLLLFLARAVLQRIDAAWYGALSLLAIGIVASLLKGLDWQEALVLAGMFAAIFASRRHFYRKSSLLQEPLSPSWLIMIAVVIAGTTWLGFFSYKHIEYSHELWWQFSYKNDTSRFLRSLVVIAVPVIAMLIRHLLGVRRPEALSTTAPEELDQAMPVIRHSARPRASWRCSATRRCSGPTTGRPSSPMSRPGNYWIVMGDPVGRERSFEGLLWRFREEADRYGAKIVLYQVAEHHLPLYLDLGLVLLKLGQEARVPLADFTLEGKRRENLRHGRSKLVRLGFRRQGARPGRGRRRHAAPAADLGPLARAQEGAREGLLPGLFRRSLCRAHPDRGRHRIRRRHHGVRQPVGGRAARRKCRST